MKRPRYPEITPHFHRYIIRMINTSAIGFSLQASAYRALSQIAHGAPKINPEHYKVTPESFASLCEQVKLSADKHACFKFVLNQRASQLAFEGSATLNKSDIEDGHANHTDITSKIWGPYTVMNLLGGYASLGYSRSTDSYTIVFYGFSNGCVNYEVDDFDLFVRSDNGQYANCGAGCKLMSILGDTAVFTYIDRPKEKVFIDPETGKPQTAQQLEFRLMGNSGKMDDNVEPHFYPVRR